MTELTHKNLHAHYLKTMGIPVWIRRQLPQMAPESSSVNVSATMASERTAPVPENIPPVHTNQTAATTPTTTIATPLPQSDNKSAVSKPIGMDEPLSNEVNEAPPPQLEPKLTSQPADTPQSKEPLPRVEPSEIVVLPPKAPIPQATTDTNALEDRPLPELDWISLPNKVAACTACELHQIRSQTVFGVGLQQAGLMLIGEAPGADEDEQGEPFVGRAGQLLNAMLYAIHLKREQVYITNVIKCRPPNNRNPHQHELACCNAFLQRQIALIQPKLIVAVGRVAAQHLLTTDTPIGRLRGQQFFYGETQIPIIATYHPAYLLRKPWEKGKSWQDLQFIYKTLHRL